MKIVSIALCVFIVCMGIFTCCAETPTLQTTEIKVGKDLLFDLNGSGMDQTIRLQYVGPSDEAVLQLVIFGNDQGVNLYTTEITRLHDARIADLDNDGLYEILLSGSVAASDYLTYCLHFTDEDGIFAVPFADIDRGSEQNGYTETGYGLMTLGNSGRLALSGYQDILGTYVGTRVFNLKNGRMDLCDNGLWRFPVDSDDWENNALTLKRPLQVTLEDGTPVQLEIGDSFAVTASDLRSIVYFVTRDGRSGSFAVEPDLEIGYGSLINGVGENEYFEYIPYAA